MEQLAIHGGTSVRNTPFDKPNRYGEAELQELKEALEQGTLFYWQGKKVKQFQSTLAEMLGKKYCTATTSGTASIHTALGAIDVGVGDEVITSPITDIGTVVGILYQNAIPVFADLDLRTMRWTLRRLKAKSPSAPKPFLWCIWVDAQPKWMRYWRLVVGIICMSLRTARKHGWQVIKTIMLHNGTFGRV